MSKQMYIRIVILILIVIFVYFIGFGEEFKVSIIQTEIKKTGVLAPIVFILIYSVCPVLFIPITPMSILGGVLFGKFWGTLFSVSGATFGAAISFLISRYLLKDYVHSKFPTQLLLIQDSIKKHGWKFVCLARITPFIPFNLQNYFFGVSHIRFSMFIWSSFLGLLPGTFLYTYIGAKGTSLLGGNRDVIVNIIISLCLLIILSIIPYVIYKIRK